MYFFLTALITNLMEEMPENLNKSSCKCLTLYTGLHLLY